MSGGMFNIMIRRRMGVRLLSSLGAAVSLFCTPGLRAQSNKTVWSDREKPIAEKLDRLRALPDNKRPTATAQLAIRIRRLPSTAKKRILAEQLAGFATEGDP